MGGFRATKPAELLLFYSGANKQASAELSQRVRAQGVNTLRVELPAGLDPNSFFVQGGDARQFRQLLEAARL